MMTDSILERIKRSLHLEPDPEPAGETTSLADETIQTVERVREHREALRDQIEATGFVLGDAVLGRHERRSWTPKR